METWPLSEKRYYLSQSGRFVGLGLVTISEWTYYMEILHKVSILSWTNNRVTGMPCSVISSVYGFFELQAYLLGPFFYQLMCDKLN